MKRANIFAFLYVMFYCVFATFLYGSLCQVWYFIVSIPDLCPLPYLKIYVEKQNIIVVWGGGSYCSMPYSMHLEMLII